MKNEKKIITVLGVLLVIAILFIAGSMVRNYNIGKKAEQQIIYEQGINDGVQVAVTQLMQQLATCNPVPLFAGNVTINAIAVECLQEAEAQ